MVLILMKTNEYIQYRNDIRNYIGGPWIMSAKNIIYNKKYNILCADLITNITYKYNSTNNHEFINYHFERDCIDLNNVTRLYNSNGKFEKYEGNDIYNNYIKKVIGLEKYNITYFPAGFLCIKNEYVNLIKEFCIQYNDIQYITFNKSNHYEQDNFILHINEEIYNNFMKNEFINNEKCVNYQKHFN
jgi:hypothetical protein